MASEAESQRKFLERVCAEAMAAPNPQRTFWDKWGERYDSPPSLAFPPWPSLPPFNICSAILDGTKINAWAGIAYGVDMVRNNCKSFPRNPCDELFGVVCSSESSDQRVYGDQYWRYCIGEVMQRQYISRCDDVVGEIVRDQCAEIVKRLKTTGDAAFCAIAPKHRLCIRTRRPQTTPPH